MHQVITKVLLRAHQYPTDIWSGTVLVPRQWLPQLVDEICSFNNSFPHPKVNYFVYLLPKQLLYTVLENDEPEVGDSIVFHLYDALGEEHGRTIFDWVLAKPGMIDRTRVTNMKGVIAMQSTFHQPIWRPIPTLYFCRKCRCSSGNDEDDVRTNGSCLR